jgi:hypothetical protein
MVIPFFLNNLIWWVSHSENNIKSKFYRRISKTVILFNDKYDIYIIPPNTTFMTISTNQYFTISFKYLGIKQNHPLYETFNNIANGSNIYYIPFNEKIDMAIKNAAINKERGNLKLMCLNILKEIKIHDIIKCSQMII